MQQWQEEEGDEDSFHFVPKKDSNTQIQHFLCGNNIQFHRQG